MSEYKGDQFNVEERASKLKMILEDLNLQFKQSVEMEHILQRVLKELRNVKMELEIDTAEVPVLLEKCMDKLREEYRQKENSNTLNTGQRQEGQEILKILRQYQVECAREKDKEAQFQIVRKLFNEQVLKHDEQMQMSRRSSKNAFAFIRTNWGMGQEMYLFMTELIENEIFKEFLEIWGQ